MFVCRDGVYGVRIILLEIDRDCEISRENKSSRQQSSQGKSTDGIFIVAWLIVAYSDISYTV
jgi:hypothetical protein